MSRCRSNPARSLADKALRDGGDDDEQRITFAMRSCVARSPDADELDTLQQLLKQQRERIVSGEVDAARIVGAAGMIGVANASMNERAAWTLVSRVLLNLDETITKE